MVKEIRSDLSPLSNYKNKLNQVILKFVISFLLLGLAFRFLVSDSTRFSSLFKTQWTQTPVEDTKAEFPEAFLPAQEESSETFLPAEEPASGDYQPNNETQVSNNGKRIYIVIFFSIFLLSIQRLSIWNGFI